MIGRILFFFNKNKHYHNNHNRYNVQHIVAEKKNVRLSERNDINIKLLIVKCEINIRVGIPFTNSFKKFFSKKMNEESKLKRFFRQRI